MKIGILALLLFLICGCSTFTVTAIHPMNQSIDISCQADRIKDCYSGAHKICHGQFHVSETSASFIFEEPYMSWRISCTGNKNKE